jgi:hypothetical protein
MRRQELLADDKNFLPAFSPEACSTISVMATEVDPARVIPHVILQAADLGDARILEVGAGDGRLTFQYSFEARSVIGIDTKELDIRSAVVAAPDGNPAVRCGSYAPAYIGRSPSVQRVT